MVFSSLSFLLLFLPVVLLGYYILPKRCRNGWLVIASLFFYASGEPHFVYIFMAEIIWNWLMGLVIGSSKSHLIRKLSLFFCIFGDLAVLCIFKYADFFAETVNNLAHTSMTGLGLSLPIGISFYTFQAVSYAVDIYRGETPQENPILVALYLALFPQLIAGPIVRYSEISPQLKARQVSFDSAGEGFMRFCCGLCKKVLLANNLGSVADLVFNNCVKHMLPAPVLWLGALCYTLQIFFDFSGYSDMAIGLGRMFGFTIPENFRDPYLAVSGTDFWRRWHISLSSWFRDYVYIPLGGSYRGKAVTIRNLVVVWALTGLWHGAGWTYILWGLLWGILLIAERFMIKPEARSDRFRTFYRIMLLIWIVLMWTLFRAENIKTAAFIITGLFSPGRWLLSSGRGPLIALWFTEAAPWLVIGAFFSSSVPKAIKSRLGKGTAGEYMAPAYAFALFLLVILSLSFLINGSYNPFLYFQF